MDGGARLHYDHLEARPAGLKSTFEVAAGCAERLPARHWDAVGVLLAATTENLRSASEAWRPIWADEAMHRADAILRLFAAQPQPRHARSPLLEHLQYRLAIRIAERLREFDEPDSGRLMPCSVLLRDLVHGLVALFGPGTGVVSIRTNIERLALTRDRRKALILLAWELVTNALLHAFRGQRRGQIDVGLKRGADGAAFLRVCDNGARLLHFMPSARCSVSNGLATVLEADMQYGRDREKTTIHVGFATSIRC
jgi:hypothetical protein